MIRDTRVVDLANAMDPKLVAVAFGITPEATMIYLADHVHDEYNFRPTQQPEVNETSCVRKELP